MARMDQQRLPPEGDGNLQPADLQPAQAAALRHKAEDRLRGSEGRPAEVLSEADARALVHELQVHQIELEMQNEELQRAGQRPKARRRSITTCSTSPRWAISSGMPRATFWRSTWSGPSSWA